MMATVKGPGNSRAVYLTESSNEKLEQIMLQIAVKDGRIAKKADVLNRAFDALIKVENLNKGGKKS